MILHLLISCDPCIDRQIHTYLIMTCISDISVKSDLKFYFMNICKDVNIIFFAICIFSEQTEEKGIQRSDSLSEYDVAQCKTWELCHIQSSHYTICTI